MLVISLHQPWASLMAFGAKRIETRSWEFPKKLPAVVAIHASKRWNNLLYAVCQQEPYRAVLSKHGIVFRTLRDTTLKRDFGPRRQQLARPNFPLGQIVAVGRLIGCVPTERVTKLRNPEGQTNMMFRGGLQSIAICTNEWHFGDYTPGRFAWVFDEIEALSEPVGERGHQSLWRWVPSGEALAIADRLCGYPIARKVLEGAR